MACVVLHLTRDFAAISMASINEIMRGDLQVFSGSGFGIKESRSKIAEIADIANADD